MLRFGCILSFLLLVMSGAGAETTALPGLIRAPLSLAISLPGGRKVTLEALVIRPDQAGRFPLVVLSHGTPRTEPGKSLEAYRRYSPTVMAGPAVVFAQHGYATVSILRRGFGRSDGPYAERISDCDKPDYMGVGKASAEDVRGAVSTLRREPWVDPDRVVLVGRSSGGFATVAAGAANPPGVIGALNFSGGQGSFKPDQVCNPDRLVDAVTAFGRTARIPELWLYAENDHYFAPTLASRMFNAYTAAGGPAKLVMFSSFGTEGHALMSRDDVWWPSVSTFLASLHLPTTLEVEMPPANYGSVAYEEASGRYGLSRNHDSQPHADEAALHECAVETCKIVFRVGPHQCGVIALSEDGKVWGGAVRPQRGVAELAALENCQKRTSGKCVLRGSECNR